MPYLLGIGSYRSGPRDTYQSTLDSYVPSPMKSLVSLGVAALIICSSCLHIDSVRKKCLAKLALIRRADHYLPCSIRKLLYLAIVLPHLDYCSVVWHSCGTTLSDRVERIQNYAMRMILQKPPTTRSHPLRQMLGWTTLHHRRHLAMLGKVHRCLTNRADCKVCRKRGS